MAYHEQVDLTKMPRSNPFRPDFMATGPHAVIQKNKPLAFVARSDVRDDDDDEGPSYKFYESEKILGKLFRAIDERQILFSVQNDACAEYSRPIGRTQSLLQS